jgi:hypothetical protein
MSTGPDVLKWQGLRCVLYGAGVPVAQERGGASCGERVWRLLVCTPLQMWAILANSCVAGR